MPVVTYLDHAASTPMHPSAVAAMEPYLSHLYANASGSHRFARRARQAVDESRDLVADIVENNSHQRIVRAAIAMAQGLDIEVAAEVSI